MPEASVTDIAVLTNESKHQSSALERIERKLDRVTDDHEKRIRLLEESKTAAAIELAALQARVAPLEMADKRWAAAAIVLAVVVPAVLRVVWP